MPDNYDGDDDAGDEDEDGDLISTESREWLTIGERENEIATSSSQDQGSLLQVSTHLLWVRIRER